MTIEILYLMHGEAKPRLWTRLDCAPAPEGEMSNAMRACMDQNDGFRVIWASERGACRSCILKQGDRLGEAWKETLGIASDAERLVALTKIDEAHARRNSLIPGADVIYLDPETAAWRGVFVRHTGLTTGLVRFDGHVVLESVNTDWLRMIV